MIDTKIIPFDCIENKFFEGETELAFKTLSPLLRLVLRKLEQVCQLSQVLW